jgi:peptide/nickel transport system ATP-binding protein
LTAAAAVPLLGVTGLARTFGRKGPPALDGVAFDVARNEVFGIVGPSGSGKSTLARILVALDRPTLGTVRFAGHDLFALPARSLRRLRARFQLVFQDALATADPRWTARRTIEEAIAAKEGRRNVFRLAEVLSQVKLDPEVLERRPHALSGGERQRVALARALALEPELVVLDEAFTGLDTVTRKALLSNLLAWRSGREATLIVIAHDLRLVASVAQRVLVLDRGRVGRIGPAKDVLREAAASAARPAQQEPEVP